jgi:hypothetical protein
MPRCHTVRQLPCTPALSHQPQVPTTNHQPPTTSYQPPTANHQPTTTVSDSTAAVCTLRSNAFPLRNSPKPLRNPTAGPSEASELNKQSESTQLCMRRSPLMSPPSRQGPQSSPSSPTASVQRCTNHTHTHPHTCTPICNAMELPKQLRCRNLRPAHLVALHSNKDSTPRNLGTV